MVTYLDRACIATLAPAFNTNRMVQEYTEKLYLPAFHRAKRLRENGLKPSVELAHQKDRLRANWGRLRIEDVNADTQRVRGVHESLPLSVTMNLADLRPEPLTANRTPRASRLRPSLAPAPGRRGLTTNGNDIS